MISAATLPKITVVTPSFNQGQFLEETILSVLGQSFPNLEYILIDGGSTDNSVDIIKKYEKQLAFWVSEKDHGQSHAINKGFAKATGDILCWLNSDDLFLPGTFAYMASLYSSLPEVFIAYGNCIHFLETNQVLHSWGSDVVGASKTTQLENYDFIYQPSSFWSRKTWEKLGPLKEDIHFAFDWEWFLRAKAEGVTFHADHKCLSMYRIHNQHKTGTGGGTRQNEILNIYQQYSNRYAMLYQMIREEKLYATTLREKLIHRSLKLLQKSPMSPGYLLKYSKPKKYKDYSYHEMDKSILML